jgi:hypothetical protein
MESYDWHHVAVDESFPAAWKMTSLFQRVYQSATTSGQV